MSLTTTLDPFSIARDQLYGDPELADLESDWSQWLPYIWPGTFVEDFAGHHGEFWDWVWGVKAMERPDPSTFVAAWARGGAKSTNLEAAVVALGARRRRRYVLYICETQEQADNHVSDGIESLLSSPKIAELYPALATRAVGMYGSSKGWRRNRLRTAIGLTVDALGLDTAARGFKVDEDRPDLIVFDDIDSEKDDGPNAVEKKIRSITKKILPARARHVAMMFGQNLIHQHSIMSRLCGVAPAEDKADFLQDRKVSGPIPALYDFTAEQKDVRQEDGTTRRKFVITSGTPSWSGQDLKTCQEQMDDWGYTAFCSEAQHDVDAPPGGMYDHITFEHVEWGGFPDLLDICVYVDPAVTNKDRSDAHGVQADGIDGKGRIYRLFSWERRASPEEAMELAIAKAYELNASVVGVETDQGGDTWGSVFLRSHDAFLAKNPGIKTLLRLGRRSAPAFTSDKAGEGHGSKTHRGSLMLHDYERGGIVHVLGTHHILEKALKRFPITKPLDLADAAYWSWWWLREGRTQVGQVEDHRLEGRR